MQHTHPHPCHPFRLPSPSLSYLKKLPPSGKISTKELIVSKVGARFAANPARLRQPPASGQDASGAHPPGTRGADSPTRAQKGMDPGRRQPLPCPACRAPSSRRSGTPSSPRRRSSTRTSRSRCPSRSREPRRGRPGAGRGNSSPAACRGAGAGSVSLPSRPERPVTRAAIPLPPRGLQGPRECAGAGPRAYARPGSVRREAVRPPQMGPLGRQRPRSIATVAGSPASSIGPIAYRRKNVPCARLPPAA